MKTINNTINKKFHKIMVINKKDGMMHYYQPNRNENVKNYISYFLKLYGIKREKGVLEYETKDFKINLVYISK